MKWYRVWAIVVRHGYLFPKSLDRITDAFLWPILDVIMLGLSSQWMTQASNDRLRIMAAILTAVVLFRFMWQSSYEVGLNLLEECWNRNFTNLWSTPITRYEWLAGSLIVGLMKLAPIVLLSAVTIQSLYAVDLFLLGWSWLPSAVLLIVFGWSLGFAASALVLYFGVRAQALSWTLGWVIAPLCATYFPVSFLPDWIEWLARALPSSYVFENMRSIVLSGHSRPNFLLIGFGLDLFYLALSLWFFNHMFSRAKNTGFDHLE